MKTYNRQITLRNNSLKEALVLEGIDPVDLLKKAVFFDIEHYSYKLPRCIGIFGGGIIEGNKFISTQYLFQKKEDLLDIAKASKDYLRDREMEGKKYLISFSGRNDLLVLDYFFKKFSFNYDINKHFIHIDLQREIDKRFKVVIGLKALEGLLKIKRKNELISGSNISKTFRKLYSDDQYMDRILEEKIDNLLLYNHFDFYNLYYIVTRFNRINPTMLKNHYKKKEEARKIRAREENTIED